MRTNGSLYKGLKILEILSGARSGLKLADIARHIEQPSSNASIFLNTLIEGGYAIKDGRDGLYYISGKLHELTQNREPNLIEELKGVSESEMKRLHDLYNENVIISTLSRHHLTPVVEIPSSQAIRIINRQEDLFLPHVTAAKLTQSSLSSPENIKNDLDLVRKNGWAVNLGEYDSNIYGVAAPILINDEAIAAIVVQYPVFRHAENLLPDYANEIMASAKIISSAFSNR
jgi:DNA-binding IclR family transcriptional regulator